MRPLNELNDFRRVDWEMRMLGEIDTDQFGYFAIRSPTDKKLLRILITGLDGWDHLSISRHDRCPNWDEMSFAFSTFFLTTETAMQIHVPVAEHISNHPYCLHIWRPHDLEIPKPPAHWVGVKDLSPDQVKVLADAKMRVAAQIAAGHVR